MCWRLSSSFPGFEKGVIIDYYELHLDTVSKLRLVEFIVYVYGTIALFVAAKEREPRSEKRIQLSLVLGYNTRLPGWVPG